MNLSCTECGKRAEGTTGLCATHNKLKRKVANIKLPDDPKPIAKVSEGQSKLLAMYSKLKKKAIHGQWCGVHGKPCLPTDVHHTKGRGEGFADSWAEERGVPLLLDTRHWLLVCRAAHDEIERNPNWAKENGYSEDRLVKTLTST